MKYRLGVRAALILLVMILVGPVLALVVYTSISEQETALEKARTTVRIQAQLRAASQEQLFEGVRHLLMVVSHAPPIREAIPERCSAYLRDLQEHFPQYAHLAFADARGNLVCRSALGSNAVYVGDRKYFQGAVRTGRFTIGEYLVSRVLNEPAVALSLPVYVNRELHGVLYAVLALGGFQKQFEAVSKASDTTDVITDADGIVLASAGERSERVGEPMAEKFVSRALRTRNAALGEDINSRGEELIYAVHPVNPGGGGGLLVASFLSKNSVLGPAIQRLQKELAILLGIALAATLLAWHMGDGLLAKPIKRVLSKLNALEQGEPATLRSTGAVSVRELVQIDQGIDDLADALAARSAQRDQVLAELQAQTQTLEASERRYRAQFEASPQPMWVFDMETLAFLVVNDAAVAHYGYTREEFMRMTLADIRPPEDMPRLMEILSKHEAEPVSPAEGLMRHRCKDGVVIKVEIASHPLDWGGRRARVAIVYDVTSRELAKNAWKRLHQTLEQKVAQRTRELELANEELEAFSYSVSHDLRAPLQVIDGFCGILAERYGGELPAQANHYVERIRAGSLRMNALIEDLLGLAKSARAVMQRQPVSIASLARHTIDKLRQQYPQRQVNVEIEEPVTADGDPGLIAVLLDNLIGNAWKFTAARHEAMIRVGTSGDSAEGPVFFVSDNGAGFDMAHAGKLFKPFERLHTVSEFEGTGIGLAIVERIVHRHGGRVWADSTVGKGARFFFTLPQPHSPVAVELAAAVSLDQDLT